MGLPAKKQPKRPFPAAEVETTIREWLKRQEEDLLKHEDPFKELGGAEGTVFGILPTMPSHQAVEVILKLEPVVGYKIPEKVVKRGGYQTHDEMVEHLLEKLSELDAKQQP